MSVKYSLAFLKNPMRPQAEAKVYAKAQVREEVGIDQLSDEISYSTSLTDGDVYNVVRAVIRGIKDHLKAGDSVCLDGLGKFQFQISSEGADTAEEFTVANIRRARIQFRPGKGVKEMIPNLEFEQVIPVKARQEAKRAMKAKAQESLEP